MAEEAVPTSTQSDGRWRIAFVPSTGDPLSVADLDAADLITYSLTADGFNHTVTEDTVEDPRLTLKQNLSAPGRQTETLELTYIRSTDPDSAQALLTEGTVGFLVVRRGVDNATEWTVGDKVDVLSVQAGVQRPNAPAANGVDTISQGFYFKAPTDREATLVA